MPKSNNGKITRAKKINNKKSTTTTKLQQQNHKKTIQPWQKIGNSPQIKTKAKLLQKQQNYNSNRSETATTNLHIGKEIAQNRQQRTNYNNETTKRKKKYSNNKNISKTANLFSQS